MNSTTGSTNPTPEALAAAAIIACDRYPDTVREEKRCVRIIDRHFAPILAERDQLKQERDGLREVIFGAIVALEEAEQQFDALSSQGVRGLIMISSFCSARAQRARYALTQPTAGKSENNL